MPDGSRRRKTGSVSDRPGSACGPGRALHVSRLDLIIEQVAGLGVHLVGVAIHDLEITSISLPAREDGKVSPCSLLEELGTAGARSDPRVDGIEKVLRQRH